MRNRKSVGYAFSDHIFEERLKRNKGFSGSSVVRFYRFIPLLILSTVFVLFSMRLFTLQIVRAGYYSRLSDENRIRTELISAPRGIILDRNGNALVRNIPAFGELVNKKIVWLEHQEALKKISKGEQVFATIKRDYVYKDIFSHVVGYVGQINSDEILLPDFKDYGLSDFTGRMGLEAQYEKFLHGRNGKKLYEVNAKGERIRLLGQEEAFSGAVIHTSLDVDLQKKASDAMQKIERGAVIVTDPRDGSVLALYSKPVFDPNIFTREESYKTDNEYKKKEDVLLDDKNFPLLNRSISGKYPPGSTYKIITSIAALESKKITKDTQIEDTGILSIGGSNFGTWNYLSTGRKEGSLNVARALIRSNDIFFYHAAMKTGVTTLSKWSKEIGLGSATGIDIPGEVGGTVPDPIWKEKEIGEQWYLGDTINMSIGQGYLETTPIQVNLYTQLIANGGTIFRPHLLKSDIRIVKKDFIERDNLNVIKNGMKGACEPGGTGYPLFNFKVKNTKIKIDDLDYVKDASAGASTVIVTTGCKTGTSEAHGENAKSHAWFTVFAPFYNPEIAVTVLAENAGQGSDIAAPVARDILREYFEKKK